MFVFPFRLTKSFWKYSMFMSLQPNSLKMSWPGTAKYCGDAWKIAGNSGCVSRFCTYLQLPTYIYIYTSLFICRFFFSMILQSLKRLGRFELTYSIYLPNHIPNTCLRHIRRVSNLVKKHYLTLWYGKHPTWIQHKSPHPPILYSIYFRITMNICIYIYICIIYIHICMQFCRSP